MSIYIIDLWQNARYQPYFWIFTIFFFYNFQTDKKLWGGDLNQIMYPMLADMCKNVDRYQWFIRATEFTYIRKDNLDELFKFANYTIPVRNWFWKKSFCN